MNRKRLESIRADLAMARHFANSDIAVHAVERAEAALAAEESELRECDVGTPVEQAARYRLFCRRFTRCRECPFGSAANAADADVPCAIAWMHTVHASPDFPEIFGPADPAETPREPPSVREDAAAAAANIQDCMNSVRIEDLVTTLIPPIPSELISGMDLGYSDAGRCAAASAGPTVTDRFDLPF